MTTSTRGPCPRLPLLHKDVARHGGVLSGKGARGQIIPLSANSNVLLEVTTSYCLVQSMCRVCRVSVHDVQDAEYTMYKAISIAF